MSLIQRLFSRPAGHPADSRSAVRPLWRRIIAVAREPRWYAQYGVSDSVEGRFDMLVIVLAMVMLRMEREPGLIVHSVHLTELFVEDMDGQLRQSGVGDLMVGKHMGKMMRVLGGRTGALREALPQGLEALIPALQRNITVSAPIDLTPLAQAVIGLWTTLDSTTDEALLAARIAT